MSVNIDVDAHLRLLAVGGTLVNVGAPAGPLTLASDVRYRFVIDASRISGS